MTTLEAYAAVRTPVEAPKEWEPTVEAVLDRSGVTQSAKVTLALPTTAKEEELLQAAGFDPADYRINGNIGYRKWQQKFGDEWLHYYKFDTARRTEEDVEDRKADIEEIRKQFLSEPVKRRRPRAGHDAAVFVASDWQIGKTDSNGGTEGTVARIRRSFVDFLDYVGQLRDARFAVPTLAFVGTGDLHEGCTGFYPAQEFLVDLDRREQNQVVRRLITDAIRMFAPHFDDILVTGVPGNHGENRKKGKVFTNNGDNDDVAAMEVVQEVLDGRKGFEHVRFQVPKNELDIVVDVSGVNIGLAHGHQFGSGVGVPAKVENWWKGQTFGGQVQSRSQILVTGHFHHLLTNTYGQRTHIQAPSQDPGSQHFTTYSGQAAPTGQLVFRVDKDHPLGWDHLRVL